MRIRLFLLFLMLVMAEAVMAQNCYCDNCPVSIADADTTFFTIEVLGAANNDLSDPSQGICGFCLHFSHQYLGDLLIQLISPAGQVVTLIGPVDLNSGFTSFTNWDICFTPCGDVPSPDPGFSPVWDNNQPWGFFGSYNGSYFPYLGCLEDFNFGPVDGIWTLLVIDQVGLSSGTLTNYSITFCDDTNLECLSCEASAGQIDAPMITTCAGDSALNLSLPPSFPGLSNPADPSLYKYTYIVGKEDTLIALVDTPHFSSFPPGNYSVCGLSYLMEDSLLISPLIGNISLADLRDSLSSLIPPFCGKMTAECAELNILSDPITNYRRDSICEGELLIVNQDTFTKSGVYNLLTQVPDACDTLLEIELFVYPVSDSTIFGSICAEEVFFYAGDSLDAAGTYLYNFTDQNGCDSLVTLILELVEPMAVIQEPDTLTCTTQELVLNATGSDFGDNVSYGWFSDAGNANIFSDSIAATVSTPGLYGLIVTVAGQFTNILCSDTTFTNVGVDTLHPLVFITGDSVINCQTPTTTLAQDSSVAQPDYSYQWTGPSGYSESGQSVTVGVEGNYSLLIINQENGCIAFDSFTVFSDTIAPDLILSGDTITCEDSVVWATATGSINANEVMWTGPGINGIQGDSLAITISGIYTATLIADNGCLSQASINILDNLQIPVFEILGPPKLTCIDTTALLQSNIGASNWTHFWTKPNGETEAGKQIMVNSPGWYYLEVTGSNGCIGMDSFLLIQDIEVPIASLSNDTINCMVAIGKLEAIPNLQSWTYLWSGPDNFSGQGSAVFVDKPGSYQVQIRGENGCTANYFTQLIQDTISPEGNIEGLDTLDCVTEVVQLHYGGMDTQLPLQWAWVDEKGDTISTTASCAVNSLGNILLLTTNESNGCIQVDTAFIALDTVAPVAEAGDNQVLNCSSPLASLDGSASVGSGNLTYLWYGPQGVIIDSSAVTTGTTPGVYYVEVVENKNGCSSVDSLELFADADLPFVFVSPPAILTCIKKQVTLDGSLSDSGPGIHYQWLGPDSSIIDTLPIITVDQPGNYIFSVENTVNGCTGYFTATVVANNQPVALDIALSADTLTCAIPAIQLQANYAAPGVPLAFSWQSLSGNILGQKDTLTITSAGFYKAELINLQSGCISRDTITVFQNKSLPKAIITGPDTINCTNKELVLDGTLSEPPQQLSFTWLNPFGAIVGIQDSVVISKPGNHRLVVKDVINGCTDTSDVLITQDIEPVSVQVLPMQAILNCAVSEELLEAFPAGGGPDYLFSWTDSIGILLGMQSSLLVDKPGKVSLEVISARNGCAVKKEIDILQDLRVPDVFAGIDTGFTCFNSEISLVGFAQGNAGSLSYLWLDTSGTILAIDSIFPVFSPGVYILNAIDEGNKCVGTDTVEVFPNQDSPTAVASVNGDITCSEDSVLLDASGSTAVTGNFDIGWFRDSVFLSTETQFSVEMAGLYTLVITDAQNGCSAVAPVKVFADTLPPFVSLGEDKQFDCVTSSLTLEVIEDEDFPLSFHWGSDVGNISTDSASIMVSQPGYYFVEVLNTGNGCAASDTIQVFIDTLKPIFTPQASGDLTCLDSVVSLIAGLNISGNYAFEWRNEAGSLLSEAPIFQVADTGIYNLLVTNTFNSCQAEGQLEVFGNTTAPSLQIEIPDTINCLTDSVWLAASSSTPVSLLSYLWTNSVGDAVSQISSFFVEQGGFYKLKITRNDNGCSAIDSVFVEVDTLRPEVFINLPDTLDCLNESAIIKVQVNNPSQNWFVIWTEMISGDTLGVDSLLKVTVDGQYAVSIENEENHCRFIDTIQVEKDTSGYPQYSFQLDSLINCYAPIAKQVVSIEDNTPDVQVSWGASSATGTIQQGDTFSVTNPGWYYLLAVNLQSGCKDSIIFSVNQNVEKPSAHIEPADTLSCDLPAIVLDGSGSQPAGLLGYSWEKEEVVLSTDSALVATTSGTYLLIVQDTSNGCADTSMVTVLSKGTLPIVEIDTPEVLNCERTFVRIKLTDSLAKNEYLQWFGPEGYVGDTDSITVIAGGWYSVEVEDTTSGCVTTDSVLVIQDTVAPAASYLTSVPLQLDCSTSELVIDALPISLAINYYWEDEWGNELGNAPQQTINTAGTYLLIVENQHNLCRDTQQLNIAIDTLLPEIVLTFPDTLNCINTQVQLSSTVVDSNYTFIWSGPAVQFPSTVSQVFVTEAGQYELVVTDTQNNCMAKQIVTVYQDTVSPVAEIQEPDVSNCFDTIILLDGSLSSPAGFLFFKWTTTEGEIVYGENEPIAGGLPNAVYQLTVTNIHNGCEDMAMVAVPDIPASPIGIIDWQHPQCYGYEDGYILVDTILGGEAPFGIRLDDGVEVGGFPKFGNLSNGLYTINIVDARGCTDVQQVFLQSPDSLIVELGVEKMIQLGELVKLEAQTNRPLGELLSLRWGSPIVDTCVTPIDLACMNRTVSPLDNTIYTAELIDINGCRAIDRVLVRVDKNLPVFVPNAFSPNGDGRNDKLTVYAADGVEKVDRLAIFDRWGELVFESRNFRANDPEAGWDGNWQGQQAPPGVYVYTASVTRLDGKKITLNGSITLVR